MKDKQRLRMARFGDKGDKMTRSYHLSPGSEKPVSGVTIVGPVWRGRIEIVGSLSIKLDGLEIFMPNTSYSKVVEVELSLQPSICFSMKNRHVLWPKYFDEVGAAHDDIELFIFPEISRSETDYSNLVEHMIADDLAMTSRTGNLELIIYPSLEQEHDQQQIHGKYYLWGIYKMKGFRRNKLFKGKKASAAKRRIGKSTRALYQARKPNICLHNPLLGRTAPSAESKLITTTPPPVECDLIPPLSHGCKRARSQRRRITTTLHKEADVCKALIADFPGSALLDTAEKVTIIGETKELEQRSWDSNMEIDEPSDSCGINVKEIEVEQRSWDSNMEIDEPLKERQDVSLSM